MNWKANHAGWIKFLTTTLLFLLTFSVSSAQVIDFSNVTPDQGDSHSGPITASGADGVEVTVEYINIETSNVVNSGLFSARDCNGTSFEGLFFGGDATAGCAISDFIDNKYAVRLTFSEPVDISRIDLAKFNDFVGNGTNWDKEVRFFQGTPTTTFTALEGDDSAPTDFDFSGLKDMSADQAITEFSVGFTEVTQIWFYAAYVNIPDFPTFDGVAVEMNWLVDQIHYGPDVDLPTVSTDPPSFIETTSALLGGNVSSGGGAPVTEKGVVYGTSPSPDLGDNVEPMGSDTGSFSGPVINLIPNQQYYVRAYAQNSEGTAFGNERTFTTQTQTLTIDGSFSAEAKTYDGTVDANIANNSLGLSGVVPGANDVQLTNIEIAFMNADAGSNKTVEIVSADLSGSDAGSYDLSLSGAPTFTNGVIDPLQLSVINAEAQSRAFDGTTDADITGAQLDGVVGSDDVSLTNATSGTFANAGPGDDIPVTTSMGLTGSDAGNYTVAQPTLTADIRPRAVVTDITLDDPTLTNADSVGFTITFNEPVGLNGAALDITTTGDLSGVFVDDVSPGTGSLATTHTVTVNTGSGDGDITVTVPAAAGEDQFGNDLDEGSDESDAYTIDKTPPEINTITAQQSSPTNETDLEFVLVFSEDVQAPVAGDFNITNASFQAAIGSGGTFTLVVNPDDLSGAATVSVEVLEGGVEDLAGNTLDNSATESVDYDGISPSPVISSTASSNTNVSPIPVEIDFGEPVAGFSASLAEDAISAANGTGFSIEDFEADGADEVFTFDLVPDADDTFTIELAAGVVTDLAGNDNVASNALEVTLNTSQPQIAFTAVEEGGQITDDELESPINNDFFTLFIDFGEQVQSFGSSDIGSSNANLDNLATVNLGNGIYEVRVEPLGDGEVTISIAEGAVQDLAGNDNEEGQFQINSDQTPPTVTSIQRATGVNDPTNQSPFDIVITFSEEISDFDESELSVTNGSATDFSTADNVEFVVEITPDAVTTSSNFLEIGVPAGGFTDLAGNENEADTENFTIEFGDTRPTAELSSSESDPTNADDFEVTLVVTEIFGLSVSSIDASDFTINRAAITSIDASSNPAFTLTVEPLEEGEISVQLNENSLFDAAGNQNEASDEFTITYDISPPTVAITSSEPDPTNAEEFEVTFTFSKPVFNFEVADIMAGNAQLSGFTGNAGDTEYTVMVSPDGDGLVTVGVPEGVAQDGAGNDNEEAETFEIFSDRIAPTIASIERGSGVADPTNQSPFDIVITFSEEIADFDEALLAVTNGEAVDFSTANNIAFTVSIQPDEVTTSSNILDIGVPAGVFTDLAGNENEADTEDFTIEFGDTRPTAELSSSESDPTNADDFQVTLMVTEIFGQAVSSIDASDFTINRATIVNIDAANNPEFVLTVEPQEEGEVSIQLNENVLEDVAGNLNEASNEFTIETNRSAPEVVALDATIDPAPTNPGFTNVSTFELQLQFSEPMADFDTGALNVDNASVSQLDEDNQQTFTLGVTADGVTDSAHTVSVEVPQGAFSDEAGNTLGNSESFSIVFGDVRPTAVFTTTTTEPNDLEPFPVTLTITEIFGQDVSGFDVADIISDNVAQIELVEDSNPVFELMVTPDGVGPFEITLSLPEGAVSDIAGNENEASDLFTIGVERGVDPLPVPVSSPLGLVILAMLMLMMGVRAREKRNKAQGTRLKENR